MKKIAQEWRLVDGEGVEWARAVLSPSRLNAIIKGYARANVHLIAERIAA